MMHNLQSVIDIIFPPSPSQLRLRNHTTDTFSQHYTLTTTGDDWALSHYTNQAIKAAITECKYHNNRHATNLLASLLSTWLATQAAIPTLLVPIPLSSTRLRKRGYNQVEQVCRALPDQPHITVLPTLLIRTRDTVPQTTLTRVDRLANMQEAFMVPTKAQSRLQQVQHVIICDDVLTTGATLAAGRAAVIPHLPRAVTLTTIAWAH